MKYQYWKIAPTDADAPWIRRPLVEVTLYGPQRSLTFAALVDSGADHCLFHADVAEALGIDRASCQSGTVEGIEGEPYPCFYADLALEVQHLPRVTVPVMFWEKQPISLIGQNGFFDLHRIKFERDHDVFEITPMANRRSKAQVNITF